MRILIVGSHTITELDHRVKMLISHMCDKGWYILVGDHSGLDAVLQDYLVDMHTDRVRVYTSRPRPHHNLGGWLVRHPPKNGPFQGVPRNLQNTLAMADAANCGMVLWDGKSLGTYFVIAELVNQKKLVWVYLPEREKSHTLRTPEDVEKLLRAYTGLTG